MDRNRRPPGVEEALSSMLWTPYERTPTDSSEDEPCSPFKFGTLNHRPAKRKLSIAPTEYAYRPTETHLYPEPIRYGLPTPSTFSTFYTPFLPKTINKQSQNHQLPSYENIEQERYHHSLTALSGNAAGIYFIPPYARYGSGSTSMVNSFTDDFLQYQVSLIHFLEFTYILSNLSKN